MVAIARAIRAALHAGLFGVSGYAPGCGPLDAGSERLDVSLEVTSVPSPDGGLADFSLPSGWHVHLDEAKVVLGPIYLRGPRREQHALFRALVPLARAHSEHAQTLTEGQVLGEYLESTTLDALSTEPVTLGTLTVEPGRLDRVSVMLSPASGPGDTRGKIARLRGHADRAEQHVDFSCGLSIEGDADDTPENLAERRRVDQIVLDGAPQLERGTVVALSVHLWRWLERVNFDALVGASNACAGATSTFLTQWYLGIRRPEAFDAELILQE